MPNRHSVRFLFLLTLLISGLALVGCSDDETTEDPNAPGSSGGSGDIFISTEPVQLNIPWTLTMPGGESVSGVNNIRIKDQGLGDYTISWPQLAGWHEPRYSNVTLTLQSGSDLSFTATYLPLPGTVQISIAPAGLDAPWTLMYPGGLDSLVASGDTTLVSLIPGAYEMKWGFVADFDSLASTTANLGARNPLYLAGKYVVGLNNIFVSSTPADADASWSISGPADFSVQGSGQDMVPFSVSGDYTITWEDVDGMVTPDPETITTEYVVDPGAEVDDPSSYSFVGVYTFIDGAVTLNATLGETAMPWSLTGPTNATQFGEGTTQLTGLRPGAYTVNWLAVDGWVVPETGSTLELAPAGSISFSLEAEAALMVNPLPVDLNAPWQLSGPGGFSQDGTGAMQVDGLAPGSYTITWTDVAGWTSPASSSQTLAADHGLVFEELYIQGDNTLFVNSKPADLSIPWEIAGPSGFSESGEGSTTFSLTETGNYTITWGVVAGYLQPGAVVLNYAGEANLEFDTTYQPELDLVSVPGGTFDMGSIPDEGCRSGLEVEHEITITRPFLMKATEVTNAQYVSMAQWAYDHGYITVTEVAVYDNLDGSTIELLDLQDGDAEIAFENGTFRCRSGDRADHPVKEVTWFGAAAYCDWVSLYRGLERAYHHQSWECGYMHPSIASGFRLPTEAEWELACRGGSTTAYALDIGIDVDDDEACFLVPSGTGTTLDELAWFDEGSGGWSREVGQLLPNDLGLYDMHGNVSEWCNDWNMDTYYTDQSPSEDPPGPLFGEGRIYRGGYFYNSFANCRSAGRAFAAPENATYAVGFRVVLTDNP